MDLVPGSMYRDFWSAALRSVLELWPGRTLVPLRTSVSGAGELLDRLHFSGLLSALTQWFAVPATLTCAMPCELGESRRPAGGMDETAVGQ